MSQTLILASASPQRRAILAQVGMPFTVEPTGVEELTAGEPATVAVENARRKAGAVELTEVVFRALTAAEVEAYVGLGEWAGRAGGYAIQGAGAALVRSLTGDYLNVVGLPLARLLDLLPHRGLQEIFRA